MRELLTAVAIEAAERGWAPDVAIRAGIRRLCAARLASEARSGRDTSSVRMQMSAGPIAVATGDANRQHYEQPPELFVDTLGPRLKYSCCLWDNGVGTLAEAEERALEETCRRARITDGMDILELGCGWGSLTLWMAHRYPNSRVTAVSNSGLQRKFIESRARESGFANVQVITADINAFDTRARFDRVVSVEMFEHMRNYRELLRRIAGWMRPEGLLFVHVFAHKRYAYSYETGGAADWMARNFFTGGVMPSADLLPCFDEDVRPIDQWWWNGMHYSRTAEAWLANMSRNRERLLEVLGDTHGSANAALWFRRWRMFYLACAELWGYQRGEEWGVAHYLFEPRTAIGTGIGWSIAC